MNKLIFQIWLVIQAPAVTNVQLSTLPRTTHCLQKAAFLYLLSIFCQSMVSDQFLFPFSDSENIEIKMHFVFSELVLPKCHLEYAKLSDLKQKLSEQNDLK